MIHQDKPENFTPKFEVVSCFVEYDGEILLLQRRDNKLQGDTWGVPAGKIDEGELPVQAMIREAVEETNLKLLPTQISYITKVYVSYPEYDFVYYMYHVVLTKKHDVVLNMGEHSDFAWVKPDDALNMDLIQDLDVAIKHFYKIQNR